jgi:hypothetical protein
LLALLDRAVVAWAAADFDPDFAAVLEFEAAWAAPDFDAAGRAAPDFVAAE